MVGYGSMLLESFVAIMAMIAAASLPPGQFFAINSKMTPEWITAARVPGHAPPRCSRWPRGSARRRSWRARADRRRSPSGMASIFGGVVRRRSRRSALVPLRGHVRGAVHPDHARRGNARRPLPAAGRAGPGLAAPGGDRLGREHRHERAVRRGVGVLPGRRASLDPRGGIRALWPLFGLSNQLLAGTALAIATTILVRTGRARYAWVTAAPLAFLLTVTMTAGVQLIASRDPSLGLPRQSGGSRAHAGRGVQRALDAVVAARVPVPGRHGRRLGGAPVRWRVL